MARKKRFQGSKQSPAQQKPLRHISLALKKCVILLMVTVFLWQAVACQKVTAPKPEDKDLLIRESLHIPNVRLGLPAEDADQVRELEPAKLPPLDVPFESDMVAEEEDIPDDDILQELLNFELRLPMIDAEHYHPLAPRDAYDLILNDLLFTSLFHENLRGEPEPELIDTVRYNEDGTVMELTLRDDFYFADGSLVEAEDVLEALEILCDEPATPLAKALHEESPWTGDLVNILAAEKIDAFGIKLYLREPDPFLHYALNFPILKHGQYDLTGLMSFIPSGEFNFDLTSSDPQTLVYQDRFKEIRPEPYLKTIQIFKFANEEEVQTAFQKQTIDICVAWPGDNPELDQYSFYPYTLRQSMSLRFNEPNDERPVEQMEIITSQLSDLYFDEALFKPVAAAIKPAPYPFLPQHMAWQQFQGNLQIRSRPDVYTGDYEAKTTWTLLASNADLFSEELAQAITYRFERMNLELDVRWLPPEEYQAEREAGNYDLILETFPMSLTPDPGYFSDDEARRHSLVRPHKPFFFFDPEEAQESMDFFSEWQVSGEDLNQTFSSEDYAYYFQMYLATVNFMSLLNYNQALYLSDRIEGSLNPLPLRPLNGWEGLWKWSGRILQQDSSS